MCACPTARVRPSWSSFLPICWRGFCVAAVKPTFLLLLSTFWPGASHKQTFCHSPLPSIFSAKAKVPKHPLGTLARGLLGGAEGGCCSDPAAMPAMPVTSLFSTSWLLGWFALQQPLPLPLAGAWERARKLGLSRKVKMRGKKNCRAQRDWFVSKD